MTKLVDFSLDAGVGTITLNRPDAGNGISLELASELLQVAIRCDEDEAVRCVVLQANGPRFCVGGDLQSMIKAGDGLGSLLKDLTGHFHLAVARLARMPKPLVTSIHGAAAGAGVSLAILGDIAIAGRGAHFTWAYSALGFTSDGGLSWFLPRLIGLRRAQEFALLGKRMTADDAAGCGLITRAVDDDKLKAEVAQVAATLAASATASLGRTRELLVSGYDNSLESHLEVESRSITAMAKSTDGREGLKAFVEKRKPVFYPG